MITPGRTFFLLPLCGAPPVLLGMTREEVYGVLGRPKPFHNGRVSFHGKEWFLGSSFQVSFNESGHVEFIELCCSTDFTANIFGFDPHRTRADEVVAAMRSLAVLDEADPELGSSYIYPQLALSFWRHAAPDAEDPDRCRFFETVGVGVPGYYGPKRSGFA